jgi:hypothetical protein
MVWFSEIVRVMEIIMFAEIVRLAWMNKPNITTLGPTIVPLKIHETII